MPKKTTRKERASARNKAADTRAKKMIKHRGKKGARKAINSTIKNRSSGMKRIAEKGLSLEGGYGPTGRQTALAVGKKNQARSKATRAAIRAVNRKK